LPNGKALFASNGCYVLVKVLLSSVSRISLALSSLLFISVSSSVRRSSLSRKC